MREELSPVVQFLSFKLLAIVAPLWCFGVAEGAAELVLCVVIMTDCVGLYLGL